MSEETNTDNTQVVQSAQEAVKDADHHNNDQNESQSSSQGSAQESFREIRERLKEQEENNRSLREQNQYFMQQLNAQLPQREVEPEFNVDSLPDDDIATTDHIKKSSRLTAQRLQQLEERTVILDLRDKYGDFKSVCDPKNIKLFAKEDPDYAQTVLLNPSLEKRWELVYKAIKRSDFYKDKAQANKPRSEQDDLADYNATRPRTTAAVKSSQNRSPLGQARAWSGVMSEEQKREQYKKSLAIANGEM